MRLPIPQSLRRGEVACLLLLGVVLFIRFPVKYFLSDNPFFMDFSVYRFTAELVTTGQGAHVYDLGYKEGMLFRYAPIWAVLWAPLGWLPSHLSGVVWSAASVGWVVLTVWLSGRILTWLGMPHPAWAGIAAAALLARQLISVFSMGQADLWTGGLLVLFLALSLRGRPWPAALALALCAILKLPAMIFLPYLVCAGRWGLALRTLVWIGLLVPLGAVLLEPANPFHLLAAWGSSLAQTSPGQTLTIGDQSFLALLGRFFTNDGYGLNVVSWSRPMITALAVALDGLLFLLIVLPARATLKDPRRLTSDVALVLILMVLASPAAWLATYTVLLFPMMLALGGLSDSLRTRRLDGASLGLALLVGLYSLLTHSKVWKAMGIYAWRTETYVFLVFMIPPLVGLTLMGLLWSQRRRVVCPGSPSAPDTSRN